MKKNVWYHTSRFVVAALLSFVLLLSLSLGQCQVVHADSGPAITLAAYTLKPGQEVNLTGQGFAADEYLTIQFSSDPGTITDWVACDNAGYCAGPIYVPTSNILEGNYIVTATGTVSGLSAQASVRIIPDIMVNIQNTSDGQTSGGPGSPLSLSGAGFAANETVTVYWGSTTGIAEGTPTSDAQGNLNFNFSAPTNATPGSYKIFAVRTSKPASISTTFKIVQPKATLPAKLFGSGFSFSYVGFQSGEDVDLSLQANGNQTLIYTAPAGPDGASDTEEFAQIPLLPAGMYTLTFLGKTSGITLNYPLAIVPGLSLVQQNAVNVGSTINVNGYGFSANETVSVFFQTASNGAVTATTDATGSFTAALTLPDTFDEQTIYYVYAKNSAKTESAKVMVPMQSPQFEVDFPVSYGETAQAIGYGFASNELVDLYWNYQQAGQILVASVNADSNGRFDQEITVPSDPDAPSGQVTVAAIGQISNFVVTTTTTEMPELYTNPTIGTAGTQVQLTSGGFAAGETVSISFNGVVIASTTADATGAITVTFVVPDLTPDYYTIVATGVTSQVTSSNDFGVLGS